MAGALFGIILIERAPYHRIWARVLGAVIVIWVCMERAVLGYHSIGQVTVGAVLGIALHFYSTNVPQFMMFVDTAIMTVGGLIALLLDPMNRFAMDDTSMCVFCPAAVDGIDNLFAWFFWGLSIQVFALLMIAKHYSAPHQRFLLKHSYRFIINKYVCTHSNASKLTLFSQMRILKASL